MRSLLSALLFAALLAPAVAAEPPPFHMVLERGHPLAGRVWEPASGRFLTPAELAARAAQADAVLLGETHDNPDHHALQAWVVERLTAAGRRPAVAFEMLETDQQKELDLYLSTHPGDLAGLGPSLKWDQRGWPDWNIYRPIAEAAVTAGGSLRAASLPREAARRIGTGDGRADAPAPSPAEFEEMAAEIRASHCNMLPEKAVAPMVRVQSARDAEMARVLADSLARPGNGGVVLVAGAGHARTDRGVPAHLARLAPAAKALSIAFVEVQPDQPEPPGYAGTFGGNRLPFDLVWFTPKAEREDPCALFERHMKGKGGR